MASPFFLDELTSRHAQIDSCENETSYSCQSARSLLYRTGIVFSVVSFFVAIALR
jgi:hypothetical protein